MKAILGNGNILKQNCEITIGGSKSESNRLLILKAQFPNITIQNLSDSEDTKALHEGLEVIKGTVDVHHAGTAMRFLTAYFAAKEGSQIILTGSKRMQERPIGILVNALKSLGADIEYLQKDGFPPLKIYGKTLQKKQVRIQSDVSSQFISALMLIAPMLPEGLQISLEEKPVSKSYFEMTLGLLHQVGIEGIFNENKINIPQRSKIEDVEIIVESDWSSASYFYSLVALSENLKITLRNFSKESFQGDSVLSTIYKNLGVETIYNSIEKTILIFKVDVALPDSLLLELSESPDLAQTIAVSCFGLGIGCRLTGLQTLKIKETDRLLALKNELTKLGAQIEIDNDSLQLEMGPKILPNVLIETYQDHRMAMAFAPLAIKTNISINDSEVVSKSYPNFWNDLKMTGISCEFNN